MELCDLTEGGVLERGLEMVVHTHTQMHTDIHVHAHSHTRFLSLHSPNRKGPVFSQPSASQKLRGLCHLVKWNWDI